MKYITTINEQEFEVELLEESKVRVNGEVYEVDFEEVSGQHIYTVLVNGRSFEAHISESLELEDGWDILLQGALYQADVIDERERRLRAAGGVSAKVVGDFILKSPMPGLVVNIPVGEGDEIAEGDVLIILESMKMQNELKAPRPGVVTRVSVSEGNSVEQRQELVSLSPLEEEA